MKPQDSIFFLVLAYLIYRRSPKLAAGVGIGCLIAAIPLFAKWIFFTAERLTWYASIFIFFSIVLYIVQLRKK